jgi:hypothetical protein
MLIFKVIMCEIFHLYHMLLRSNSLHVYTHKYTYVQTHIYCVYIIIINLQ